jgi:hypothetical protein
MNYRNFSVVSVDLIFGCDRKSKTGNDRGIAPTNGDRTK